MAMKSAPGPSRSADLSVDERVEASLKWLKRHSSKAVLDGMARYAIPSGHAYGVAMRDIKAFGKTVGTDHDLSLALFDTGVYEARMLASFVGDPHRLTAAQMDRWCAQFDNWAICDAMSFNLFDRTSHAWKKVRLWSGKRAEFEKRTAFALLWSLTVHDKAATDAQFIGGLALVEREAKDDRNFVRKAVNMALRAVGKRNRVLHGAAVELSQRLSASDDATARWIGKDASRELTSASVMKRFGDEELRK